jgi:hypothetical protein
MYRSALACAEGEAKVSSSSPILVHHTVSYRNQKPKTHKMFRLSKIFMCIEIGSHLKITDATASCSLMHAVKEMTYQYILENTWS